jgi:hypothetical protein
MNPWKSIKTLANPVPPMPVKVPFDTRQVYATYSFKPYDHNTAQGENLAAALLLGIGLRAAELKLGALLVLVFPGLGSL